MIEEQPPVVLARSVRISAISSASPTGNWVAEQGGGPEPSAQDDTGGAEPEGLIADPATYAWTNNPGLVPTAVEPEAPGVAGQTWVGRRRRWLQILLGPVGWVLVGLITYFLAMLWNSAPEPMSAISSLVLILMAAAVMAGMTVAAPYFRPVTLTIDAAGVRFRKGRTERAIAFADMESVSCVGAPRYIRIQPRPEYCARAGIPVPSPVSMAWSLPIQSFTPAQLTEILPALEQGVTGAGGWFFANVPGPTRR